MGPDGPVHVEPKVMEVLLFLAQNAGRVVSRQEIIKAVWGENIVTDEVLSRGISLLRQHLDDDPRDPLFIQTIPKRGYQLIVPVIPARPNRRLAGLAAYVVVAALLTGFGIYALHSAGGLPELGLAGERAQTEQRAPAQPADTEFELSSVAVLPFTNLGDINENDYFTDGLSEELIIALSKVDGLSVAARRSSFAFKNSNEDIRGIGEQLEVDAVLEGTVRKEGAQIRITAQLVDTGNGYQVWSHSYDGALKDVFAVQGAIAEAITEALVGTVLLKPIGGPTTRQGRAYELYLQGRQVAAQRNPSSLATAIEFFGGALELDPAYAEAYASLAQTYLLMFRYGNMDHEQAIALASPAVDRALELNPDSAAALNARGLLSGLTGDVNVAERAFRRAIELHPEQMDSYLSVGALLHREGRYREAQRVYLTALNVNPYDPLTNAELAANLMAMGRFDEAMMRLEHAVERNPNAADLYRTLAHWSGVYSKLDAAVRWATKAVENDPDGPASLLALSSAYLGVGDFDRAAHWLERARIAAPRNASVITHRSVHYFRVGDFEAMEIASEEGLTETELAGWLPAPLQERAMLAGLANIKMADHHEALRYFGLVLAEPNAYGPAVRLSALLCAAYARQALGEPEAADALLTRSSELRRARRAEGWQGPDTAVAQAAALALQDQPDQALSILAEAVRQGWSRYYWLRHQVFFERLESREQYRGLLQEMRGEVERQRARLQSNT